MWHRLSRVRWHRLSRVRWHRLSKVWGGAPKRKGKIGDNIPDGGWGIENQSI